MSKIDDYIEGLKKYDEAVKIHGGHFEDTFIDNAIATFQRDINNFMVQTLDSVKKVKDELVTYAQNIEKKRIENNEDTIKAILEAINNEILLIQNYIVKISEQCVFKANYLTSELLGISWGKKNV